MYSMMTSVLRDSLGGNCKTIMIATINPEAAHTEESLSTCRFAQRVSLIKNRATINEGLDPEQVIKRLKNEIIRTYFPKKDMGRNHRRNRYDTSIRLYYWTIHQ